MQTNRETQGIMPLRPFVRMAFVISSPIIIQNLISTLVNAADTLMLGYVSQNAMAASSLANQVQTVLFMLYYGLTAGASVLGAQYWGRKDIGTIERVLGMAARAALLLSFTFFALVQVMPAGIMRLFTTEPDVIAEGARYLRIVSVSWLFAGFSQIYVSVQRSVERVLLPTVTYVASLLTNVVLNATFIFGLFGTPKLGLVGVAWGTVTARFVESAICLVHSALRKGISIRLKALFARSGVLMKDFLRLSVPSMVNDGMWSLASMMFSVILGHLGSDAVAANAVAVMARGLGAMVARGLSSATTIIIGKSLGEDNMAATKAYAKRMTALSALFGALGGLGIVILHPAIMAAYADKLTPAALGYVKWMLFMEAYHVIGVAVNTCWICGCFRGGGDARFGMYADTLSMWLVAVPLVALAAFAFRLPVPWVYFVLCLDEFEKMLPCWLHYRRFEWMKNITRDKAEIT